MRFACKPLLHIMCLLVGVCLLNSCTTVKKNSYPPNTPFVFSNEVRIEGVSKDEKKRLVAELENYWEDSLRVRKEQRFLVSQRIVNPAVFDSSKISLTKTFMRSYLRSQGFYNPDIKDTILPFDTVGNQIRVSVRMDINTGKPTIIDSFTMQLADSTLQRLAINNPKKTAIKPGVTRFSVSNIASELDRSVNYFRQNGYFRIGREDVVAHVDTLDEQLLAIETDPFEQVRIIAEMEEKRKLNPTASIAIKLRKQVDTSYSHPANLKQYYVDSVYYYPEYDGVELPDSAINKRYKNEHTELGFIVKKDNFGSFKMNPLREHTFIRHGQLYDETRYLRTLNAYNQMGPWSQVDAFTRPSGEDSLNFHILLTEAPPHNVTFDLEASRNTGDFLGSTNLFGISFNTSYRNRNLNFPPLLAKKAFQYSAVLRNGVELSFGKENTFLQTVQTSLSQTLVMPRLRFPIGARLVDSALSALYRMGIFRVPQQQWRRENPKTLININAAYTDRREFFRLRSLTGSWGYDWKRGDNVWSVRIPNLEFYGLDTLQGLVDAFRTNPFLRAAFNTGSIVGLLTVNYTKTFNHKKYNRLARLVRYAVETSGFPGSQKLLKNVYQYVKFEHEQRWTISYPKSAYAFRFFGGLGFNYSNEAGIGITLPFYKQFVAGGPNSMRAWGLRQLGLGSSLLSDTSSSFRDRFGDMQLEVNLEARKTIFSFGSFTLNGALFADIGNIWNVRKSNTENAEFNLKRLGRDIAIGTGVGLRFDFGYFLVRLDLGFKLKDPARLSNNGWLKLSELFGENEEFPNIPKRSNYAIQLGVGLPF